MFLKSVAVIVLVVFVGGAVAKPRSKKTLSGEKIYDLFPKPVQGQLKAAWKVRVRFAEKQYRAFKVSVSRQRNKEKKLLMKKALLIGESNLKHLKTINDPPLYWG